MHHTETPRTLYPLALATALAAQMQEHDESGWTYRALLVNADLDYAVIQVFDDEGILAGIF